MYHNSFYGKKFLDYGSSHFPIRMRADILDFNIWVFLFFMIIRSFYTKGDFCSMIFEVKSHLALTTINLWVKASYFLLVDLREKNFRFGIGGKKKEKRSENEKSSENDQLTGHFQSFFYISPKQTEKHVK